VPRLDEMGCVLQVQGFCIEKSGASGLRHDRRNLGIEFCLADEIGLVDYTGGYWSMVAMRGPSFNGRKRIE